MKLVGAKVKHKSFGTGQVIELSDNLVIVKFSSESKTFVFPEAFENHLNLEDPSLQDYILSILEEKKFARAATLPVKFNDKNGTAISARSSNNQDSFFDALSAKGYCVANLSREHSFDYHEVEKLFGISRSKFGRGINVTDSSIVLISSITKNSNGFVYHDVWAHNGDYIYSGEGQNGDQKLIRGNKAIVTAKKDNKEIYLLIKTSSKHYYYQGVFELIDYTLEDDKDEHGNVRKEYKFRLRKK